MIVRPGYLIMNQRTDSLHPAFADIMFTSEEKAEQAIADFFAENWVASKNEILYVRKVFRSYPTGGLPPVNLQNNNDFWKV